MNIIGLVVSACVIGIAMSSMQGRVNTLLALVTELSTIMMKITTWVILVSPIGIFFLTVSQIIAMDNLNIVAGKLGLYLITVICGILFHGFIVLPIIFYAFTRKNPYAFIGGMGQAICTAFGTASSSATLPVTIQCLEEKNQIDSRISRFMLPIGATINMDGTALYEAVAAIFIAQLRGIPLPLGKVIAVRYLIIKWLSGHFLQNRICTVQNLNAFFHTSFFKKFYQHNINRSIYWSCWNPTSWSFYISYGS